MNNLPLTLVLAMTEAEQAIVAGQPIEAQLKAAMQSTRNHWVCTNEDEQFRATVGAVMQHYGPDAPEFKRLEKELRQLQGLSAAMSGVPIDWTSVLDQGDYEPIGLLGLWREVS